MIKLKIVLFHILATIFLILSIRCFYFLCDVDTVKIIHSRDFSKWTNISASNYPIDSKEYLFINAEKKLNKSLY